LVAVSIQNVNLLRILPVLKMVKFPLKQQSKQILGHVPFAASHCLSAWASLAHLFHALATQIVSLFIKISFLCHAQHVQAHWLSVAGVGDHSGAVQGTQSAGLLFLVRCKSRRVQSARRLTCSFSLIKRLRSPSWSAQIKPAGILKLSQQSNVCSLKNNRGCLLKHTAPIIFIN